MKGKLTVVTPRATTGTPNPFAALAEAEAEDTTEPEIPDTNASAEAALEINKDKYLPNQVAPEPQSTGEPVTDTVPVEDTDATPFITNDLSLSSISTTISTDNTDEFSKAKISALVERIQTNITKAIKAYTHTDIANF